MLTTCANRDQSRELAELLVERRLAACVNIMNQVTSIYRWRNKIEQDEENLLVIKTTENRFAALQQMIQERSSYELPEIVAVRVHTGSADYLNWLADSVDPDSVDEQSPPLVNNEG